MSHIIQTAYDWSRADVRSRTRRGASRRESRRAASLVASHVGLAGLAPARVPRARSYVRICICITHYLTETSLSHHGLYTHTRSTVSHHSDRTGLALGSRLSHNPPTEVRSGSSRLSLPSCRRLLLLRTRYNYSRTPPTHHAAAHETAVRSPARPLAHRWHGRGQGRRQQRRSRRCCCRCPGRR